MKPFLVVNPQSGGGATKKVFPDLRRTIEAELGEVEVAFTERAGHGSELAKAGAESGHTLIIAVGGDGTFNEVVNGVLASGKKDVELGIIGQGTGGDFLRSVGIEHRLDRYLSAIRGGKTRKVDVGHARYTRPDGTAGERYFVNVISAGMGGLVDRYVATSSRALGGKAAYFVASARALLASREGHLNVEVTRGASVERHRIATYMIAVCNGRYFGSGMKVAPMAEIDDGRFEIVSVGAPSKLGFALTSGTSIYSGAHLQKPGVLHMPCDKVTMDLENEQARSVFLIDLDGEPVGGLPLTIELRRGAVSLRI
jgi:diacylglycerol kinase (ATP)